MDLRGLANTSVIGVASLFMAIGAFFGSAGSARSQSSATGKSGGFVALKSAYKERSRTGKGIPAQENQS